MGTSRQVSYMMGEPLDHGGYDLTNAALQFAVVSDGCAHGDVCGINRRNAESDQLCGVDEQPSGDAFFQSVTT